MHLKKAQSKEHTRSFDELEILARKLIARHLGSKWKFRWSLARSYQGLCRFSSSTISVSRLVPLSKKDFLDTLLHEIAHAIAGPYVREHGPKWQRIAYDLGAEPFA